ncbi:replication protein P [Escherichia coli]
MCSASYWQASGCLANHNQNELNEIRRQWYRFRENGITTMEQVNAGIHIARRQNQPLLPSPRQLPPGAGKKHPLTPGCQTPASWLIWFTSIAGSVAYPDAESYPWKSNAHYWLVTNLYQNMRANALTIDAELRRKAADELTCMTARINGRRRCLNRFTACHGR